MMKQPYDEDVDDIDDFDGNLSDSKRSRGDNDESKLKLQDQIDRRREQNRVLARRTRQRKKNFFESLQKQAAELVKENEILKGMVKAQRDEDASSDQNRPTNPPKYAKHPSSISQAVANIGKDDYRLLAAIQASQRPFCITNPALPDNPIVFANKSFLDLTGYNIEQVLGRNCRFLQGPGTDRRQIDAMKKGIADGTDTTVCLLNYRADGSSFHNQIYLAPLRDTNSTIVNYVGVQIEMKEPEKFSNKPITSAKLVDYLLENSENSRKRKSSIDDDDDDGEGVSDDDMSFDFDDFLRNSHE
eukprot:gene11640-24377_t